MKECDRQTRFELGIDMLLDEMERLRDAAGAGRLARKV